MPTRVGIRVQSDRYELQLFVAFAAANQTDSHEKGNNQSSYPAQRKSGHGNSSIQGGVPMFSAGEAATLKPLVGGFGALSVQPETVPQCQRIVLERGLL